MMRVPKRVLLLIVLVAVGCGDSAGGGGGAGGTGNPGGMSFSASVDGQSWAADEGTISVTGNPAAPSLGTIVISGADIATGRSLILALSFVSAPGTYPLGVNVGTTPGGTASVTASPDSWLTPLSGGAGTVTITVRTTTRIAGSFSFTADPLVGGGPATVVSNGKLDITVDSGLPALATSDGSTATATLGGSSWNAATVIGLNLGAGLFSFTGDNTAYSINMTPKVALAAGNSYGIPSQVSFTIIRTGTVDSWAATGGADVGTWTVDTFSTTGASGTFQGTLPKLGGGPSLDVSDAAYDLSFE
ncbi:MAG: DUF6252 family protein [Polyangiales bacterium]